MGDEEKMEDLAGHVEETEAKQENLTQQTQYSPEQQVLDINQVLGGRGMNLFFIEMKKEMLKINLKKKRPLTKKIDKSVAQHEQQRLQHMKMLERIKEERVNDLEESIEMNYKRIEDDRTFFEEQGLSNPEKNATIKKLTNEMRAIKSGCDKTENIFNNCKIFKEILLPPELQEAQQADTLKAEVPSHSDDQDEQSKAPQESEVRQGLDSSPDRVLPSTIESTLPAAINDKLDKNSEVDRNSTEYEQPLELATEVREQSLSLIQNGSRVDETLEEVEQTIHTAAKKINEAEEKVTLRENDKTERRDKERVEAAWLKKMVQFHESIKTEDKDVLLGSLGSKVKEVYTSCMGSRSPHLNILEKLSSVEYRMCSLLQLIESIPADRLEKQRQIKEKERKNCVQETGKEKTDEGSAGLLEENLRLEEEKRRERRKKCLRRSLSDNKKNIQRKLLPRCLPVEKRKIKVCNEKKIPVEDELFDNLLKNEDSD